MDTLAKRLKAKREDAHLSQAELAKLAGLKNQSIIAMLETGERKTSSHVPKIAKALGVEALWLSSGIGPEKVCKTVQLSEQAMKIALAVNEMPQEYQDALLHLIQVDRMKTEGKAIESQQPSERPILALKG